MFFSQFLLIMLICLSLNAQQPNIVLLVGDDIGYNDVSWHDPAILTPNLGRLARAGTILDSHYALPSCSPSRTALLTGYHPFRTSIHGAHEVAMKVGLNTRFTLLPQFLKNLGYSTHAVGKWHLGFCHESYIPTRRGFDTFVGFYGPGVDFYERCVGGLHFIESLNLTTIVKSFVRDERPFIINQRLFSIFWYNQAISEAIVAEHAAEEKRPFFMYLSYQQAHPPFQANEFSKATIEHYCQVKATPNCLEDMSETQRMYLGYVNALDYSVGHLLHELKSPPNQIDYQFSTEI